MIDGLTVEHLFADRGYDTDIIVAKAESQNDRGHPSEKASGEAAGL